MRSWRLARNVSGLAVATVPVAPHKPAMPCEAKQSVNETCNSWADRFADIDARTRVIRHGLLPKRVASGTGGPLFKFGVIADIQHADIKDGTNFSGKEMRQYRGALDTTREAVKYWEDKELLFVAQLGDIIDGQNAGKYGDGKTFTEPQSWTAVERVFDELGRLDRNIPYLHAIGNHELYNFSMEELSKIVGIAGPIAESIVQSSSPFYYSFSPHPGWRIVMLNAYEWSVSLPEGTQGRLKAEQILHANHPNADAVIKSQGGVDYFDGLSGMAQRFVPFNGAFGEEQLQWLSWTLRKANEHTERVIILSHLPLHPMSCNRTTYTSDPSARNLAYDAPEALSIMWEDGAGCVVAVLAGHSHRGGYFSEPSSADHINVMRPLPGEPGIRPPIRAGLHHVTVEAALTHKHAYGHIEVYPDRLELVGAAPLGMSSADSQNAGFIPSRTMWLEPFKL